MSAKPREQPDESLCIYNLRESQQPLLWIKVTHDISGLSLCHWNVSHAEYRLLLLLRNCILRLITLALAELALGLVRLERGALTESLVAEVAHVGALPGVCSESKGSHNKMTY